MLYTCLTTLAQAITNTCNESSSTSNKQNEETIVGAIDNLVKKTDAELAVYATDNFIKRISILIDPEPELEMKPQE
jgi:hypothetical protein